MDTYCLVDESGVCYYGDVQAWRLSDDLVEIELDPPAARVLGTDRFALRLIGADAPASTVRAGLEALLA